jgi:phospholipid/cholesterol/gamma-HCH transport system substrate-binding protein
MLKAGDTITMTQSAIVLENLIGQFLYSKAADSGAAKPGASGAAPAPADPAPAASAAAASGASGQ